MGFNAAEWSERICSVAGEISRLQDWGNPAKAEILNHVGGQLERYLWDLESVGRALDNQAEPIPDLVARLPEAYRDGTVTLRVEEGAKYCVIVRPLAATIHPGWRKLAESRQRGDAGAEATFTIYVENTTGSDDLVAAVEELGQLMGYGDPFDAVDESGSRWRRWRAKAKAAAHTETADAVLYALELAALKMRQAEVAETLAGAAESLCRSLADQAVGIARLESVLVLKYPVGGVSVTHIHHLSTAEILILERFPEIERYPARVLDMLAMAVSSDPEKLDMRALLEGGGLADT